MREDGRSRILYGVYSKMEKVPIHIVFLPVLLGAGGGIEEKR